MNVISHQHVGVKHAAKLIGELFQIMEIKLIVVFGMEADRAIVTPLNDVPRNTGERQTGATRA